MHITIFLSTAYSNTFHFVSFNYTGVNFKQFQPSSLKENYIFLKNKMVTHLLKKK
uniref:Uncharacterized protein n=1 Tax=Anguilla anguilla TaxID=7936 RepID=A0A0E9WWS3_ANGAN